MLSEKDMVKKAQPQAILFRYDWIEALSEYPTKLRHKVFDAIINYVMYGELPDDEQVRFSVFPLIRKQLQQDAEQYAEVCSKRREAINSRWREKDIQNDTNDTNVYNCIQEYSKNTNVDNIKEDNIREDKIKENKIKEESVCEKNVRTHTHTHEGFSKFISWCERFAPDSLRFDEPLTVEHFVWLHQKYGADKIKQCASDLHSKGAYKRNKNAMNCWKKWIERL